MWTVKDNQGQLRQDIAALFEPKTCTATAVGAPAAKDMRSVETVEKGHGCIERRTVTASTELKGYLDWPHAEQIFKLERHFTRVADGKITHQVAYGVTSLTPGKRVPNGCWSWHVGTGGLRMGRTTDGIRPCVKTGVISGQDTPHA